MFDKQAWEGRVQVEITVQTLVFETVTFLVEINLPLSASCSLIMPTVTHNKCWALTCNGGAQGLTCVCILTGCRRREEDTGWGLCWRHTAWRTGRNAVLMKEIHMSTNLDVKWMQISIIEQYSLKWGEEKYPLRCRSEARSAFPMCYQWFPTEHTRSLVLERWQESRSQAGSGTRDRWWHGHLNHTLYVSEA